MMYRARSSSSFFMAYQSSGEFLLAKERGLDKADVDDGRGVQAHLQARMGNIAALYDTIIKGMEDGSARYSE